MDRFFHHGPDTGPHLTEIGVSAYLASKLRERVATRNARKSFFLNVGLFVFLVAGVACLLYYRRKSRPSAESLVDAKRRGKTRILRLLADHAEQRARRGAITNLPLSDSVDFIQTLK